TFLPVDIYKSDATRFMPEGENSIRLPFVALKGLGEAAAIELAKAGKQGDYISRADIIERAGVSKKIIEILAEAKALEGLPESSQMNLLEGLM
ncbi:MAG: hypothetical protein IJP17_01720, partial [Clostridia bacterium]|nr:hypothetical protein [Clostridia bacterium]